MISQLPRKLERAFGDATAFAERVFDFAGDVYDYLRTLPTLEITTFNAVGGAFPVTFASATPAPVGVVVLEIYEADAPGNKGASTIAWSRSADATEPGIAVSAMSGLTSGTEYVIRVLVIGERT